MKQNILLKLSGASLKNENDIICYKKINKLADEIIDASELYNIGIVIGGGNIWRGNVADRIGMDHCQADEMGMLATIINSLALKSAIQNKGKEVEVYSALSIPRLVNEHNSTKFKKDLAENKIVIFGGGTGMPFFSTDTGASLAASEINAKYILMGKNNIDGLYDKDPNVDKDAKFIESITFDEVISQKLKVADLTCMTMCQENNIDILIFDIEKENSIKNVLNKQGRFSLVYNKNGNNQDSYSNNINDPYNSFVSYVSDNTSNSSNTPMSEIFEYKTLDENKKSEPTFKEYKSLNDESNTKKEKEDSLKEILKKMKEEYSKVQ